jgi:hypothetical protein
MLHSIRYVGETTGFRDAKKPALRSLIASEKNPDNNAPYKKANRDCEPETHAKSEWLLF